MTPCELFAREEYADRCRRLRKVMDDLELDACLVVAPENQFYFAGYDSWVGVNSPQALVVSKDEAQPVSLLVRDVDLFMARESAFVDQIDTYRLNTESFPDRVEALLQSLDVSTSARIGVEMDSYALTYGLGQALAECLHPIELINATVDIGRLRIIKSDKEIELMRRASVMANEGLIAARESARPGMTEKELGNVIENAVRSAGSDYWAIPVELSSGVRTAGGHATPTDRVMQSGELVHMEFAGVCHRYHGVAVHTFALGEPGKLARKYYDAARESLSCALEKIKPGVVVSDIEEASLEPLRKRNLDHLALMRFGYGIGIAYPPIWLEPLQISRDFDDTIENNMTFVLHAYLQDNENNIGVIQGGTWAMVDNKLECLVGGGDIELEVLD